MAGTAELEKREIDDLCVEFLDLAGRREWAIRMWSVTMACFEPAPN
jgi:hypothetical protein